MIQFRLISILSALVVSGCVFTQPSGPHGAERAQLNSARQLWKAQALDDYTYVFSRGCFCVFEYREPVTITVRGGNIISVVSVASGSPRDASSYRTLEALFDIILNAIDKNAATIRAEYHPTRGHVTTAYIDMDQRIADEEISFEAKSLTPLR